MSGVCAARAAFGLVALIALIACEEANDIVAPPTATKLAFVVQPADATAGVTLAPSLTVAIQDESGRTITDATGPVTIDLGANPNGGQLLGTRSAEAVAGVATFSNLRIERAAVGYTLVASAGSLASATSAPFTVAPGPRASLAFVGQPRTAQGNEPIPTVRVAVLDVLGNAIVSLTDPVTIGLQQSATSGSLSGTLTATAVQGVATFSDLRIDRPGTYQLTASTSSSVASFFAYSAPFDITLTFASLSAGDLHTCGMTTNARAYCWGSSFYGQLGTGTSGLPTWSTPVLVRGEQRFTTVSAGGFFSCGLATGGTVYCWGENSRGQLGDGTTAGRENPAPVSGGSIYSALETGFSQACALASGGAVHCWGGRPATIAGAPTFVALSVSGFNTTPASEHACGLTSGGEAYCWGSNAFGQLGDGTTTARASPVRVAANAAFAALAAGATHGCGLTAAGAIHCWGDNLYGQLGDGTRTRRPTPAPMTSEVSFASVTSGGAHSCALTAAGAAYCWGWNALGQLGDGTTTDRSTPVRVGGDLAFVALTAGLAHTCGLVAGGAAYCWGSNSYGEIGNGTYTHQSLPALVWRTNGPASPPR